MKKLYFLALTLTSLCYCRAQYVTLLWEDFQDTILGTSYDGGITSNAFVGYPYGIAGDTNWTNYDNDAFNDASGGNRPGEWDLTFGFSAQDSTNIVAFSNSWTSPATAVSNYLITPSIQITDTSARLSWKSAPFQTPLYLDGYVVLVSTTSNDIPEFTDTLFVAAEYVANTDTGATGDYNLYTFSDGVVHGQDGQYIEVDNADLQRNAGVLRPFSVSLAAYDNMAIYIAFLHNSADDNLISLDDILVEEIPDITFSTQPAVPLNASFYPNPASEILYISYSNEYENATVEITDMRGVLMHQGNLTGGGQIPVASWANGMYMLKLTHPSGNLSTRISVLH